MEFIADKQTLTDLNVLGKYNATSLYSIFNQTVTHQAAQLMDEMFRYPLTDHVAINARVQCFQYFAKKEWVLPFSAENFAAAEQYLLSGDSEKGYLFSLLLASRRYILKRMGVMQEFQLVQNGMQSLITVLRQIFPFLHQLQQDRMHPFYAELQQCLNDSGLKVLEEKLNNGNSVPANFFHAASLDHQFRSTCYRSLKWLFLLVHRIDLAVTVGKVARERKFTFPLALEREAAMLELINCRHPALKVAVGNDCRFDIKKNLLFLTGANMAGKSTYMKSLGAAFYLAHMGFPVAADSMVFSVKTGIFTSINVSDNLNQGISHFYAEVMRVKEVASSVCQLNDLLVIFDELFKGTNVKDAYDATLEVTKAFSCFRRCNFVISTHIIEVGTELQKKCRNIMYGYMPTEIRNNKPYYPYKMKAGITEDRQGMMIIENEGILKMMEQF